MLKYELYVSYGHAETFIDSSSILYFFTPSSSHFIVLPTWYMFCRTTVGTQHTSGLSLHVITIQYCRNTPTPVVCKTVVGRRNDIKYTSIYDGLK